MRPACGDLSLRDAQPRFHVVRLGLENAREKSARGGHVALADADAAFQDGEIGIGAVVGPGHGDERQGLVVFLHLEEGFRQPDHRLQVRGVQGEGFLVLFYGEGKVLAALGCRAVEISTAGVGGKRRGASAQEEHEHSGTQETAGVHFHFSFPP